MHTRDLGYGCTFIESEGRKKIVYNGVDVVIYIEDSRTLRVDYKFFNGQRMRAVKKAAGDELYEFLKKHKGEDITYGDRDNDDNREKHIVRFIQ